MFFGLHWFFWFLLIWLLLATVGTAILFPSFISGKRADKQDDKDHYAKLSRPR